MKPAPPPARFASTEHQSGQSWTCVILGAPMTKKNSQRIITNPRTGRPIIIPSVQQTEWARSARLQVQAAWRGRDPLDCPVNVTAVFYRERNTGDLPNYVNALLDVLQPPMRRYKKGERASTPERGSVLLNDSQVALTNDCRLDKDAENPRVEVTVHWAIYLEGHEPPAPPAKKKAKRAPPAQSCNCGDDAPPEHFSYCDLYVSPRRRAALDPTKEEAVETPAAAGTDPPAAREPACNTGDDSPGIDCRGEAPPNTEPVNAGVPGVTGGETPTACPRCGDTGVLPWGPCRNAVEISHTPPTYCDCVAGALSRVRTPVTARELLSDSRALGHVEHPMRKAGDLIDVSSGGHLYRDDPEATRCARGCGAWLTRYIAGAPVGVDPFGVCPKGTEET